MSSKHIAFYRHTFVLLYEFQANIIFIHTFSPSLTLNQKLAVTLKTPSHCYIKNTYIDLMAQEESPKT